MRLRSLVLAAAFLAAAVPAARTEDVAACLIKRDVKDGKTVLTVIATPPSIEGEIL